MSKSTESILDQFLYTSIPRSLDEPNYYSMKEVEKKLIENAASIQTELGGRNNRYLGLVLSSEKYQTITGHTFAPHPNPGTFPTFPPNATQPIITQTSATHEEQLQVWRVQAINHYKP